MFLLVVLLVVGQTLVVPERGYTLPDGTLATPEGRYLITALGHNCDGVVLGADVDVWHIAEVRDQAAISPPAADGLPAPVASADGGRVQSQLCGVALAWQSADPCATNPDGQCDIAFDPNP